MRNKIIKIICLLLIVAITIPNIIVTMPQAGMKYPKNMGMSVDGSEIHNVKAISVSYENNIYLSVRDVATLLNGTSKTFGVEVTSGGVYLKLGEYYSDELTHDGWLAEELEQYAGGDPSAYEFEVNEEPRKYSTMIIKNEDGYDCFICSTDLQMILDLNMELGENETIEVDTSKSMVINPAKLEGYGLFQGVNSALVGDATTGEIFYAYNIEAVYPIASTTKLMTYLLTMDAIKSGRISMQDKVVISQKAANLSGTSDGVVDMKSGWEIPVDDLIKGALLPSSNESALALAEHIAGTETAFVVMMNEKATELNMNTAVFYNSNGLPSYTNTLIPAKRQNRMSAQDMFKMVSHILNTYPEVKDITSIKKIKLESTNTEIKNTNGLLYNMPEVNGLKTGTTDKSGACLITSLTVNDGATNHDLAVVVLGAENGVERIRFSELLSRYGKEVVLGNAPKISYSYNDLENESSVNAETIVEMVIETALNK